MITIAWQIESYKVKDVECFNIKVIAVNEKGNLHDMPAWECMGSRDLFHQVKSIARWIKQTEKQLGRLQLVPDEDFPEFSNEIIRIAEQPAVNLRNLARAARIDLNRIDVDEIVDLDWNKYITHIKKALTNAKLAIWLKRRIAEHKFTFS